MITFVILLVSACLIQAQAIRLPLNKNARIIAGDTASAGKYPFLVAIYKRTSTGNYFCSGTLIYSPCILTAGQCVVDAVSFTMRLGSNNLNQNDPNAVTVATEHYVLHPDFNPATLENDVGLIKMRQSIQFTDYIKPINVVSRTEVTPDLIVFTAGWGQTSDDAPGLADNLNEASLVALSNEECKVTYGAQVTENMVCAAGNYNEGICQGDIGGPLI